MMKTSTEVFNELRNINVNEHVEAKGGKDKLKYLSWAWAWDEAASRCESIDYEIERFNGLPYVHDDMTGYMVFTNVTVNGVKREMWLPVMDNFNKAIKTPTMFEINKTIMRCLTKNLAMFGLGLYIYAGEDLPEDTKEEPMVNDVYIATIEELITKTESDKDKILAYYSSKSGRDIKEVKDLTEKEAISLMNTLNKKLNKAG